MSAGPPDGATVPPWWAEARWPTSEELGHWLSTTSAENRDWWLERVQRNTDQAARCFEFGHETAIEMLTHQLNDARLRIAWLEKHYTEPRVNAPPPVRPNMTQHGRGW